MKNQRLLELDALRGIAALAVVLFHYFYYYDNIYGHENIPVNWARIGELGVQLFFMVSGFVIFWTLNRVDRPLDFVVSRFSRLYPAYWSAILITFIAVLCFGLPGREVSFVDAVANILMFHEYLGIPHVDGVYWTLTVELTFYFWMFVLYVSDNLNKVEYFFVPLIVVSIAHSLGVFELPNAIDKIFFLKYISFFMAGICFYKITHDDKTKLTLGVLFLSLISTITIYSVKHFIVFSLFYVIFFLAVSGRMKALSIRPFVFLGSISYSLYLLHQNIGYVIINEFYKHQWSPLAGIFFSILLSVLLATFLSKHIEKPLLLYIRQTYKYNRIAAGL